MGDVKEYLRKVEFPEVVPETLSHMKKLWLPDGTTQQLSLMKELSQEFVFFEIDQWGKEREEISHEKELIVIKNISLFFEQEDTDSSLATFLFLFPPNTTLLNKRLLFLNRLVSLIIAEGSPNMLTYIGIWMQLSDCASENSFCIANNVYEEHFILKNELSDVMKNLPEVSPLFCASLTTALVTFYLDQCPLKQLLEVICSWFKISPMFCFEPLKICLHSSFNFSRPQTPLSSIMHWVIISSVHKLTPEWTNSTELFYSLHSSLLSVMTKASEIKEVSTFEAIPIGRIQIVIDILKFMQHSEVERMALSLGRLAQCLDVGIKNGCIHSKNPKLSIVFLTCINLPYSEQLKMVLSKWSHEFARKKIWD